VVVCAALALAAAPAGAQPRVRVVATGGTIANHTNGRLSGTGLVASVPALASIARVEAETFSSVSSIELTLAEWLRLSRRVRDLAAGGDVAGVVVTSGSDTLEELAWFLDLTVGGDRPVVVTGAMRRPSEPDADGPRNLAQAVRVATDPAARGRGALVVLGGLVLSARDATKQMLSGPAAFGAPPDGLVGRVDGARVTFARAARGRRAAPAFDIGGLADLPRVDVLLTYQQAPGDLVDAAIRGGAKGIVLAGAGAGALSPAQFDAVEAAQRARIPVVIASRVPVGSVTAADVPRGTVPAGSLTPVKARVLLMLALATGVQPAALPRLFGEF
jgi:L-asparaginase